MTPLSCLHGLIPIISFIVNVLGQVIIARYLSRWGLLKSLFLGFILGIICICILEFYIYLSSSSSPENFLAIAASNLITYSCLGYCYFNFITLGETARRIRILRELYDSPKGLSTDEILERYNAREIVEKRIKRLLSNGQVIYKNGKYYIGNSIMALIAKIIITMKLILLGKRSEFD